MEGKEGGRKRVADYRRGGRVTQSLVVDEDGDGMVYPLRRARR